MMIPLQDILNKHNIHPTGCIHVGAHFGQEYVEYKKCGILDIVFIEPCKEAFDVVSKIQDERVICINVACGADEKEAPMYVSHQNQGQSNSFLKSNLHSSQHPEIIFDDVEVVKMVTLDSLSLEKRKYSMLMMDTEGYEKEVLAGATDTLKNIDIVYSEVQRGETRIGNVLIGELDEILHEFVRVETFWPSPNLTWGDAIYIRKNILIE